MRFKNKLVFGVGINDADYAVQPKINGKQVRCQFYRVWQSMLERCYSDKLQAKNPTYIGCAVCEEWLIFSNFKRWMETKNWQGMELDKDILVVGNKVYSPETCAFVNPETNKFIVYSSHKPIGLLLGVDYGDRPNRYESRCRNPVTKDLEYLGTFDSELEAHLAWKAKKNDHAKLVAANESDPRIINALLNLYADKRVKAGE